jgi:serine-threonine kinase receptor-associated protein
LNKTFKRKLWDALTGSEIHSFSHKHIVKSVDFSGDTTKLVTGCNDKSLRLFDLNNYTSSPTVFSGHTSNIKKSLLTSDAKYVISISDDKTLRQWDVQSASEIKNIKFDSTPNSIEISRDGELLILAQGKLVELYNASNLEKINTFTIPTPVSSASIHPNKSVFVCGCEDFTLYKYSIPNGVELGSLLIIFFLFSLILKNFLIKKFKRHLKVILDQFMLHHLVQMVKYMQVAAKMVIYQKIVYFKYEISNFNPILKIK